MLVSKWGNALKTGIHLLPAPKPPLWSEWWRPLSMRLDVESPCAWPTNGNIGLRPDLKMVRAQQAHLERPIETLLCRCSSNNAGLKSKHLFKSQGKTIARYTRMIAIKWNICFTESIYCNNFFSIHRKYGLIFSLWSHFVEYRSRCAKVKQELLAGFETFTFLHVFFYNYQPSFMLPYRLPYLLICKKPQHSETMAWKSLDNRKL